MVIRAWRYLSVAALCAALAVPAPATQADDSLFQALGAKEGIRKFTREFIVLIQQDARIKQHFVDADLERLELVLTEQLCELAGGPCQYKGRSMKAVHEDMAITTADFNALAENLQIAMERAGIAYRAQNRLIAKLAPMKRDIVNR